MFDPKITQKFLEINIIAAKFFTIFSSVAPLFPDFHPFILSGRAMIHERWSAQIACIYYFPNILWINRFNVVSWMFEKNIIQKLLDV